MLIVSGDPLGRADSGFRFRIASRNLIAQTPAQDATVALAGPARRSTGKLEHRVFHDLPQFLRSGDVLVLNDSRVIPARLRGRNADDGGQFEILLLEENAVNDWWVMLRPGQTRASGNRKSSCAIARRNPEVIRGVGGGHQRGRPPPLKFCRHPQHFAKRLRKSERCRCRRISSGPESGARQEDRERYQTVYAQPAGFGGGADRRPAFHRRIAGAQFGQAVFMSAL